MASNCLTPGAGSTATPGVHHLRGDGAGNRDPSAFTFDGSYSYTVTLVGSYAGSPSEVGWFTKVGGTYQFPPVINWSKPDDRHLDHHHTSGDDWGFYIRTPSRRGRRLRLGWRLLRCRGRLRRGAAQQFSLMITPTAPATSWGVDDEVLELMYTDQKLDSDYNDYIFTSSRPPSSSSTGA